VKSIVTNKHGKSMTLRGLHLCLPVVLSAILVTGCESTKDGFSSMGLNDISWFSSKDKVEGEAVVLAQDPALLAQGSEVERAIHNSVELARQKRFLEARHILSEVRETQQPSSEGYRAITCTIALLALKEGDLATFKRVARQLDMSLGQPVHVEGSYVEVVTLYRTLANESLPVNAPEKMRSFKDRYFGTPKTERS
jgi:hypothetical protein